jgi:heterodisulfide reductase subunit A
MIIFEINGVKYEAENGQTILEVAQNNNIEIPTLCSHKALPKSGACRLCVVEVQTDRGSRLMSSCTYPAQEGIKVITDSERINNSRKMSIELLLARCPEEEVLINLAKEFGIEKPRFKLGDDNCILCGLCLRMCERMGVNAISFQNRGYERELGTPFMDKSDVCVTCGACSSICPTSRYSKKKVERTSGNKAIDIPDEYNERLDTHKPIYIAFPQALPKMPVIDKERCMYYLTGNCKTCAEFCEAGAIQYDQEDEEVEFDVGSIVLAPGTKPYDPEKMTAYGYGRYPNVVTSIEFERIMSASGPFLGHIVRPSDHKTPKSIAFIQCVGSRDQKSNEYCSSVCCTYAVKEAIIAQEHTEGLSSQIFFMDVRTFGRGFEDFLNRAHDEYGVEITRNARIPSVEEIDDHRLQLRYEENGKLLKKEFDMVILSVGLTIAPETKEMAERLGIDLDEYGFAASKTLDPLATNKPGVFITGAFSGPKDIPDTVAQASGAAAKAAAIISEQRGTLVTAKVYPDEQDISQKEPRIGVFVCHCGINIGSVVDVPNVVEYAKKLPYVVYAGENIYTCSQDTQDQMKDVIAEHDLNRIVVASCSPRTHEPLFQDTIREAGLNPYLFEMANIRDQCSWVHMQMPQEATDKSRDLVRMAVAKAAMLTPLSKSFIDTNQSALVIGGGLAGMTAAKELAGQGFKVDLIEKADTLGGNLRNIRYTLTGEDPQSLLKELESSVKSSENITIHMDTELANLDGYVGAFKSTLSNGKEIEHGIIILATGAIEYQPTEFLYGKNDKVKTLIEFEQMADSAAIPKSVAIIHCVGARNEKNTECSRICCSKSIKTALKIKEKSPDTQVYVLYRDMRTYGTKEMYYEKAGQLGVTFLRFADGNDPVVTEANGDIQVAVRDEFIGRTVNLKPELLLLATATVANPDNERIAPMLKVPRSKDGFFLEAHVKLRPLDFATDGIFLCGMAGGPKKIDESLAQASGAVSRACTILSKDKLEAGGIVSCVDEELCGGCGTCESICPYGAIRVDCEAVDVKASVNEIVCKGCGTCAASCPENAIEMKNFTNDQLFAQIKALKEEEVTE